MINGLFNQSGKLDLDYRKTFLGNTRSGIYGFFDPSEVWSINLNADELNQFDIYEEVYHHEFMHHSLTTSTSIGHATQIFSNLTKSNKNFSSFVDLFLKYTWFAQEGAAMLAGYNFHCKESSEYNGPQF